MAHTVCAHVNASARFLCFPLTGGGVGLRTRHKDRVSSLPYIPFLSAWWTRSVTPGFGIARRRAKLKTRRTAKYNPPQQQRGGKRGAPAQEDSKKQEVSKEGNGAQRLMGCACDDVHPCVYVCVYFNPCWMLVIIRRGGTTAFPSRARVEVSGSCIRPASRQWAEEWYGWSYAAKRVQLHTQKNP